MTLETWLAFLLAATIILVIPGPTIILVISQTIANGPRAVLPLTAGVALGDLTAMTLSLMGLGAVLAASATLFSALKLFGAVYLIYLGVKIWLADGFASHFNRTEETAASKLSLFRKAYVVTALNPKSIVFFVAFLPQFVARSGNVSAQLILLGGTFLLLATVNAFLYGFFSGGLRGFLAGKRAALWFNRCGGTVLIGAGLLTVMPGDHPSAR